MEMNQEMSFIKKRALLLGPLVLLVCSLVAFSASTPKIVLMLGILFLMGLWWFTEALPLWVTSLLPLALFPILGIAPMELVATQYMNSTLFLFIGGLILAQALERWSLQKRMALWLIRWVGATPQKLILGFTCASAFLSMWVSNVATCMMMSSLAMGLLGGLVLSSEPTQKKKEESGFTCALLLSVAYASSLGGVMTLIGTPPNLVLARVYELQFPELVPLSFGTWMLFSIPLSCFLLFVLYFFMTKIFFVFPATPLQGLEQLMGGRGASRKMGREEKFVMVVFCATVVLWLFRADITLGEWVIPGWTRLIPHGKYIDDGTIIMVATLLFFTVPMRTGKGKWSFILPAESIRKLPWDILLLFGGGFALAFGIKESGLSQFFGQQLSGLAGGPLLLKIFVITFLITFLTEFTSNTATAQVILPILASLSVVLNVPPLYLMIPAAISTSFAFMLPMATPPNAIIYGTEMVPLKKMLRVGLALNLVCIVISALYTYWVAPLLW